MDIEKLEKLAELRDKGALTQEEFESEKAKLLNSETIVQNIENEASEAAIEDKTADFWHAHGMKTIMIIIIVIGVGYMQANRDEMNILSYMVLFGLAAFASVMIKEYQKMSKDIKDLHRYKNIQAVIDKFGTPDNIQNYGDYTKYTFKKSTDGWGWFKYQTDVFTLQNGKLIKHENYYE